MNKLIGLAGPSLVGKSTVAELLCLQFNFEEKAFADPLKKALIELTGLDRKYFYDQNYKHNFCSIIGMTPRKLMQLFGTEFVRETIATNFWVERMRVELEKAHGNQVISDIRFDDEASLVRSLGGTVIVLERDSVSYDLEHKSEKGVSVYDNDIIIKLPEGINNADKEILKILMSKRLL